MKQIVVAYDKKRGIGASNDLLWLRDLPADMQHFREVTMGTALVMGRKTFESIGKPLPHRQNIVISRSPLLIKGATVVSSLEEAYAAAESEDISVIGGGQIYELALGSVDEIVATEVDGTFPEAEIFFPELDMNRWYEVSREHHDADERNKYAFNFIIYKRA